MVLKYSHIHTYNRSAKSVTLSFLANHQKSGGRQHLLEGQIFPDSATPLPPFPVSPKRRTNHRSTRRNRPKRAQHYPRILRQRTKTACSYSCCCDSKKIPQRVSTIQPSPSVSKGMRGQRSNGYSEASNKQVRPVPPHAPGRARAETHR